MERPPLVTTVELLDQVRKHLVSTGKPDSDYQVHKALGVSQPTVSDWRKGNTTMGDDAGFAVADLLGIPAEYVMACLYTERAKSDRARDFWKGVALRAANAGALAALAFLPFYGWVLQ